MDGTRGPKARRKQDRAERPRPDKDRPRPVPHAQPFPRDQRDQRDQRDPQGPQNIRGPRPPQRDPRARQSPRPLRPRRLFTRGDPGRRLGITLLCIVFVLSLFAGRLVQLQGMESGYYRNLAAKEQVQTIRLPAQRGEITAADGQAVAITVDTYQVVADPAQIPADQMPSEAAKLAPLTGLSTATVLADLQQPTSPDYDVIASNVSAANGDAIASMSPLGITLNQTYARSYPDGNYMANVLGFTSSTAKGLNGEAGIEGAFNNVLAGHAGSETVQTGLNGVEIPLGDNSEKPAVNGTNIQLTIYPALQYEAEQACEQEVAKTDADNCSVVIMQPQTGRILAMAQWPTYNPTDIQNIAQTTDIPDEDIFEPGSTAKVITAAAAFEHGGQTPMSAYNIPYSITRGGTVIHDAEWVPNERFTIAGIIAHSSNIGMSQVVQHVAPQIQYDYLRNFGLGEPTGLKLPGEDPGELPPPSQWYADTRYTLSYGQGVAVNAVQMADVYATIANGGVRVQPTLIEGTTNSNGVYTPAPVHKGKRVIQPQTAHELIQILQQVPAFDAEGGFSWGEIPGYAIAAKTGTSQETGPHCADHSLCIYGSSYIGMAPGNNPQLVVAVNVQNPRKGGYYGDEVAGPVFYQVMSFALANLKIPPDGAVAPKIRLTAGG
jgi:cell division protein FtsI (penicillin-binding protein 3)